MQENIEKHIKVSIVIPVYNPGERIHRTIHSLQEQAMREIEFISVLDCPTDGSDKILEAIAAKDSRFRVICNEVNLGVAESRNRGLQVAKGQWVGFVDDDDYIDAPDYFEKMYALGCLHQADVVVSDCYMETNDSVELISFAERTDTYQHLQSILYSVHSRLCTFALARSIWHSLYRREMLQGINARFYDRKTHLEEDTLFNVQVYTHTSHFIHLPEAHYHWDLTNQRNEKNYQSTNDLCAFRRYYFVVKELVQSSQLLSPSKKNELLSACMTNYFYEKYCLIRDIPMGRVESCFGNDLCRLSPLKLYKTYFQTAREMLGQSVMILKFLLYVIKLKGYRMINKNSF